MEKAVIYARYSSDKQTEQSIDGQVRICKEYAKKNNYEIVDTYVDRAISGRTDKRAGFQQMLKDSAKKKWKYVLVYRLDRFSRNRYEMAVHKRELKDNGVRLVSAMENISDSPESILLESLLEGLAEYYSVELTQKVTRGMKESWLKGLATGGTHSFGYDIIDKKYVINENEAKAVKFIFTQYALGCTAKDIATKLNNEGYRKPKGQPFDQKYILDLLHEVHFTGTVTRLGETYNNIFPRIIEQELWDKVSFMLEENKHGKARINPGFILSDRIYCGQCKARMFGDGGTSSSSIRKRYNYYSCSDRRHGTRKCKAKSVRKEYLENLVFYHILHLLNDKKQLNYIADKIIQQMKNRLSYNEKILRYQTLKEEAQTSLNNLISAMEKGIFNETTKAKLAEYEKQVTKYDKMIDKEHSKNAKIIEKETIINFFKKMEKTKTADDMTRRTFINLFVKAIIVFPTYIDIVYKIDPNDSDFDISKKEIKDIEKSIENNIDKQSKTALSFPPLSSYTFGNGLPLMNKSNFLAFGFFFFDEYFGQRIPL